jgi:hypothetical protein
MKGTQSKIIVIFMVIGQRPAAACIHLFIQAFVKDLIDSTFWCSEFV